MQVNVKQQKNKYEEGRDRSILVRFFYYIQSGIILLEDRLKKVKGLH